MKRLFAPALFLGLFSVAGLVGCDDTSTSKTKTEETTPEGSRTTEVKKTTTESGTPPATPESPK